jgi:hypothetical protein
MSKGSHGSGPDRDRTRVGTAMPEGDIRKTRVLGADVQNVSADYRKQKDTRKITAIMVSYSWLPEGELHIVREGKNFIGRTQVASDASHQDCDIQVARDKRMSGEHALILCRQGNFEIIDMHSANGTFLDGTMLKSDDANDLPDRATIKTGDTLWTFIKIKPPAKEPKPRPQGPVEEPKPGPEQDQVL